MADPAVSAVARRASYKQEPWLVNHPFKNRSDPMIHHSSCSACALLTLTLVSYGFCFPAASAQVPSRDSKAATQSPSGETATIKGTVEYDTNFSKSWKGTELVIPFPEIKTKLFQQVKLEPIPFPENWQQMKPEEQQAWAKAFEESEAGKAFIAERDQRIAAAKDFDVILEKDGKFVVYDVPVGLYGLRGRVDRQIDETMFGFEVFAQLEVIEGMNEVRLPPIQVAITPMLKSGEDAPPIVVETHDGKNTVDRESFKGSYVLVSFWITSSPNAEYQTRIQEAFARIKEQHPVQLLSICVDEKPEEAVKFIVEKQLKLGTHGFTRGFGHQAMFHYGVRAIPSFWLISPEGKISMSQYEFANSFRTKNDLAQIITDRIEGKDVAPAVAPPAEASEDQPADKSGDK